MRTVINTNRTACASVVLMGLTAHNSQYYSIDPAATTCVRGKPLESTGKIVVVTGRWE